MTTLILPLSYRSQARGPVEVDYSHPLAAGLVSAYNMTSAPLRTSTDSTGQYNGRKSSAGKNPYTLHGYANNGTTEARLVYSAEGAVWDFDGTYASKAYNTLHPKNWTGAVTYIIRVLLRNTSASQCLIGGFNGTLVPVYKYGCGILISDGTLYGVGAYNNARVISAPAPAAGEWVTLACVSNTSNGKLAINGRVVATGDLSGAWSGYVFAVGCGGNDSGGSTSSGAAFLDGLVGPALVFNRALSDAEIATLSDNPYQLLKSKRNYWVDAVAGLSSISNDVVLSYNLLSYAQQDKSIEWNTLNSLSKDGNIAWDIQTSVTSDKTFNWDVLNQVIADKVTEWNIKQHVQSDKGLSWGILSTAVKDGTISWDTRSSVTTNANISWNILSSAFVDKPIRYDILTNVGSNQSTSWNISQFIYADKALNWDIQSTMLTAFADIALRYDLVSKVYQDFNIYWGLLQQASSDKALNFDMLSSILSDKAIAWGIAEAVVNDLTVTANLLQNTGQELTLTWESAGIVSGDLVIKYNISSDTITLPAIKRMITVSAQDTKLKVSAQDTKLKVLKDSRIISI